MHCPQHQTSRSWSEQKDGQGNPVIQVEFPQRICQGCGARQSCTQATHKGRKLRFRPQTQHEALQQLRRIQQTPEFWEKYRKRAGIEGTLSQGIRSCHLRRTRYIGAAKTHLQHILIAVAINLARFAQWKRGLPLATTRTSPFAALLPVAG